MIEFSLLWAWLTVIVLVLVGVIVWKSGAVDKDKAGGALLGWWNKLRGKK